MSAEKIVPGLYLIRLGYVNACLLEGVNGLVLVDTGLPGSASKILDAAVFGHGGPLADRASERFREKWG